MTNLSPKQTKALKDIAKDGKGIVVAPMDKRTLNALIRRDFVKLIARKNGDIARVTAKGKKFLN